MAICAEVTEINALMTGTTLELDVLLRHLHDNEYIQFQCCRVTK